MALLPSNNSVINVKPVMASVNDVKPSNSSISNPTVIYYDSYSYSAGASMGLLLALTYPVGFSGIRVRA